MCSTDLYASIKALEKLEKGYRGGIFDASPQAKAEYESHCKSLIGQCRTAHQCIQTAFPNISKFAEAYQMHCPGALNRLVRGVPATLEHGDVGGGPDFRKTAQHTQELTAAFIGLLDTLRLQVREADQLNFPANALLNALNKGDYLAPNLPGREKIVAWVGKIENMRAAEKLTEEEARQMISDVDRAYAYFESCLK